MPGICYIPPCDPIDVQEDEVSFDHLKRVHPGVMVEGYENPQTKCWTLLPWRTKDWGVQDD